MRSKVVWSGLGIAGLFSVIALPVYCDHARLRDYKRADAEWHAKMDRWNAVKSVHLCISLLDGQLAGREQLAHAALDPRVTPNRVDQLISETSYAEPCVDQLAPLRTGLSADAAGSYDGLLAAAHASNQAAGPVHDYFSTHEWRDDNDAKGPLLLAALRAADVKLRASIDGAGATLDRAAVAAVQAIADEHERTFGRDDEWWAITENARISQLRLDIVAAHAAHAPDRGRGLAQREVKALYDLAKPNAELSKRLRSDRDLDALYAADPTLDPFTLVGNFDRWSFGWDDEPFGREPERPDLDD
jgi:hypothetical protein